MLWTRALRTRAIWTRGRALLTASIVVVGVCAAPARAAQVTGQQRLAAELVRLATGLLKKDVLTVPAIQTAVVLAIEASKLDPDNVELWRWVMKVASLAESDEWHDRALREITRLDPKDEVARLLRISLALERYDTAEERIAAYERLLRPEARDAIGDAVASRLMLDLALLQRRRGNVDAFAESLAEAAAMDPSNRSAAAIAAGFFRMRVNDPYAEAELLANVVLADPTDLTTQLALAELLLEHGAYRGAERLYRVGIANQKVLRIATSGDLLADLAIAYWGNGQPDESLRIIQERQQEVNETARRKAREGDLRLDPLARAKVTGTVRPTLATVRAAIMVVRGDPNADAEVERALEAYEADLERGDEEGRPFEPAEIARRRLEMALIAALLGCDVARVEAMIQAADTMRPLAEEARQRFDGWLALRRGDLDEAVAKLSALPEDDVAGRVGLGEAELLRGDTRAAARAFLLAARGQPGSLLGVWSFTRLTAILERRVPLSDLARKLEELAESIPPEFDRYPDRPSLAVGFDIEPEAPVVGPFDPVVVDITVTNNSPHPLAIDPEGPIRPQVLLYISTPLPMAGGERDLPPIVIDIDRRLRLMPREKMVVPVDLLQYRLGRELYGQARRGTFVALRGMLNFKATSSGAIVPALLGAERVTSPIRIEGARVDEQWMADAIEAVADPSQPEDIVLLALLSHILAERVSIIRGLESTREDLIIKPDPESRKALADLEKDLEEQRAALDTEKLPVMNAFPKLDPASQAWLLGALPPISLLEPLGQMAQSNDNRLVQLMYLLFQAERIDDPALTRALESDDPNLRYIAQVTDHRLRLEREQRLIPGATGGTGAGAPGTGR